MIFNMVNLSDMKVDTAQWMMILPNGRKWKRSESGLGHEPGLMLRSNDQQIRGDGGRED